MKPKHVHLAFNALTVAGLLWSAVLILLKLVNVFTASWWWVAAPALVPFVFVLACVIYVRYVSR